MILFKDGLKFRGIYVHNLDNDQVIACSIINSTSLKFNSKRKQKIFNLISLKNIQ